MMEWFLQFLQLFTVTDTILFFAFLLAGMIAGNQVFSLVSLSGRGQWMTAYARFMAEVVRELEKKRWSFSAMSLFIFTNNATTMYVIYLSGIWLPIQYVIIFILGYNLVQAHRIMLPGQSLRMIFFNPVAWFEFSALLAAATLGRSLFLSSFSWVSWRCSLMELESTLPMLLFFPVLLLFFSALLESWLIMIARKIQPPA